MIIHTFNDPAFLTQRRATALVIPSDDVNLWAWFTADYGVGHSVSQVNVGAGAWLDRSINARNLNVSASMQPAYSSTLGPGGTPVIYFAPATTRNLFMPASVTGLAQPFAVFLLINQSDCTNNNYLMDGVAAGASAAIIQNTTSPKVRPYAGSFGPLTGGLVLNEWHILTVIFNGASCITQVDNQTQFTGDCGNATPPGRIIVGNWGGGGASSSAGFLIAALIVRTGVPDAATRTLHKNWLAAYGGLTI